MIEIQNIHKSFEDKQVLKGVTLSIPEGQVMVIVGSSGCGKTVLLRSIIGLIQPDQGSIQINEKEVVGADRKILYSIPGQRHGIFY